MESQAFLNHSWEPLWFFSLLPREWTLSTTCALSPRGWPLVVPVKGSLWLTCIPDKDVGQESAEYKGKHALRKKKGNQTREEWLVKNHSCTPGPAVVTLPSQVALPDTGPAVALTPFCGSARHMGTHFHSGVQPVTLLRLP